MWRHVPVCVLLGLTWLWTQTLQTPGMRPSSAATLCLLQSLHVTGWRHVPACLLLCCPRCVAHAGLDLAVDANIADTWYEAK
jgi:hypothetical protein